jgi:hypothetical protein
MVFGQQIVVSRERRGEVHLCGAIREEAACRRAERTRGLADGVEEGVVRRRELLQPETVRASVRAVGVEGREDHQEAHGDLRGPGVRRQAASDVRAVTGPAPRAVPAPAACT